MAGQPITRAITQVLEEYGEENVFALYLEVAGVRGLLKALSRETGHEMGTATTSFYAWLKAAEGRRERWQEIKAIKGDLAVEEMEQLAEATDEDNVQVNRVKIDVKKWLAEKLNRAEYGREQNNVNVTINAQNAWLGALREAEQITARPVQQIEEAEYDVLPAGHGGEDDGGSEEGEA